MPKYLIEVAEPSCEVARRRHQEAIRVFGSYFAAHATWTWKGITCTRTMVVEQDDDRSVQYLVPPNMRTRAQIFHLDHRSMHKQSIRTAHAS